MKYMGGKSRLVKHIKPFLQEALSGTDRVYVEPFVGGGNVIQEIECNTRIGYDKDSRTVRALKLIRDCPESLPKNNKEYTEQDYKETLKSIRDGNPTNLDCFAGFQYAWGACLGGGWRFDYAGKRDYVAEAYRQAQKQSRKLQNVRLECKDYRDIVFDYESVIYCDPPYANSSKYKTGDFDHEGFWQWCREKAKYGHILIISEYAAPDDFK